MPSPRRPSGLALAHRGPSCRKPQGTFRISRRRQPTGRGIAKARTVGSLDRNVACLVEQSRGTAYTCLISRVGQVL